jgi:hypothetical protein
MPVTMRVSALVACIGGALALFTGCAGSTPYRTIALGFDVPAVDAPAAVTLGSDPDELRIAQVAAQVIRDRLGLPFPEETTVRVYVNQATFAAGLVQDDSHVSDEAWDRARVAVAVASPRGLFLRGDVMNSMRLLDRVGVIAHELAHVSQMEMRRGGRGIPAQWIREGHADWVKYQVLDLLGIRTYPESREEVKRAILRSTTPIRFFPALSELSRGDRWTDASVRLGWGATYGQAFLAIDWLVERYGIESLNAFTRRFAGNDPPRSHWAAVFPVDYAEFVSQFRARLEQLGG